MRMPTLSTAHRLHRFAAALGVVAIAAVGCSGVADLPDEATPAVDVEPDVAEDPDHDDHTDAGDDGVVDPDEDLDGDLDDDDETAAPGSTDDVAQDAAPAATPATAPTTKPTPPTPKPKPAAKTAPVEKPAPTAGALADGGYEGRLVKMDTSSATFDLIQVLSGKAAIDAARAAGDLDADGTLTNDVYVRDLGQRVTVPIDGEGGFQVYDCSGGCALVGTTLEQLANGTATPYGGKDAPIAFKLDAGALVSFVEIYLA
jgi:hypothetical protein